MRRHRCAALAIAWIAWTHQMFPSQNVDDWTPVGGAESLEECKQGSLTAAENSARKFGAQSKRGTTFTAEGRNHRHNLRVRGTCVHCVCVFARHRGPTRAEGEMTYTDARLWHPWLRINRGLRVMLHTRWSAEAWSQVRVQFRRALALRSEIRRAGWFN
jgi:hypothetical protein